MISFLLSALYNSWYNLKNPGVVALIDNGANKESKSGKLPTGHYTLDVLEKYLNVVFKKGLGTRINVEKMSPLEP